jgi:hypothetical protein
MSCGTTCVGARAAQQAAAGYNHARWAPAALSKMSCGFQFLVGAVPPWLVGAEQRPWVCRPGWVVQLCRQVDFGKVCRVVLCPAACCGIYSCLSTHATVAHVRSHAGPKHAACDRSLMGVQPHAAAHCRGTVKGPSDAGACDRSSSHVLIGWAISVLLCVFCVAWKQSAARCAYQGCWNLKSRCMPFERIV